MIHFETKLPKKVKKHEFEFHFVQSDVICPDPPGPAGPNFWIPAGQDLSALVSTCQYISGPFRTCQDWPGLVTCVLANA